MEGELKLKLIPYDQMELILPLVFDLNEGKISKEILKFRLESMKIMGGYECLGVFDNKSLIACCGVWFLHKLYKGKHIELDNVFVNAEYRSRGVGKLMMDWLVDYAKNHDCNSIELNSYVANEKGIKFWQRHDFEHLGYHMIKNLE